MIEVVWNIVGIAVVRLEEVGLTNRLDVAGEAAVWFLLVLEVVLIDVVGLVMPRGGWPHRTFAMQVHFQVLYYYSILLYALAEHKQHDNSFYLHQLVHLLEHSTPPMTSHYFHLWNIIIQSEILHYH